MKKFFLLVLILFTALLAACSGENEEESGEGDSSGEESRSVTVEDATGEKTIEGTPENVVVLEWSYAEELQALGMEPSGVADLDSYGDWVDVGQPFSEEVEDVGTRQEPSLEAISRLEPDLIIGVDFRHEEIAEDLEEIAPTLMFAPYSEESAENQFDSMLDEFDTIAEAVDREEEADEAVNDMEQTFEDQRARLEEAGQEDMNYVMTQAFTAQNTPTLRLFTDNSMVANVMDELGMNNDYESEELELYGYTETTVESLQNYQDSNFFYIVQDEDNIFNEELDGNPVWEDLDFVQEDRLYQMPGSTWTFGGPLSAEVLAEQVVDSIVEKEDEDE
ncbi:ABC transporter substrate-binding protein [Halobacillus sp. A5]|uniref:ABC transporter substrate-binding protein n=1 Tax=Halobacillus sp. A5 TaxID=2880263 RepID=UPI0020A67C4D|nr:iron-siderophore ABC transporter substrate-binding protein [Halobacillus sp. A5]MCP3026358.1 iron-siderophore ABC transporter substrate-binding protein [Halobacillus sp. A5]